MVPKPLTWDQLLVESIPLKKVLVVTASGGTAVTFSAAITAALVTAANYTVQLSKETFDPDGGELYISDKTTAGFKVRNTGGTYGESVSVTVWWLP
jgi:hypothetical protein